MAMERVTVEQNGERFELEVPEGTTDDQIKSFLNQQQGTGGPGVITQAPIDVTQNVAAQAPVVAAGAARELMGGPATANAREMLTVAKNATSWTPNAIMEVVSHPVETAKAFVAGHPWANTPVKNLAGTIGRNVGGALVQGAVAPESAFMLPYQMAAYEQEKIRQNPNAPGLERNPYAMSVRSQGGPAPMTQGQAGAMNQRAAVANMPYGNVTAQERAILDADRVRREQVQAQARATLQQPPSSQNFIARMKALSTLYSPVNE